MILDIYDMARDTDFTGRALQNRISDLEDKRDGYIESCVDEPDALDDTNIHDAYAAEWAEQNPNEAAELMQLQQFVEEFSGEDPLRDTCFISDRYFPDYAEEYASDIGAVSTDGWPNSYIDWKAAGDALKQDYQSIELDGTTFWYR